MKSRNAAAPSTPSAPLSANGFTLVEVMVALTIGLIILAALTQLLVTSRAAYTIEEGMARTQESGRFAMEFLLNDIRMAGYVGCNSPSAPGNVTGQGVNATCSTNLCVIADDDKAAIAPGGIQGHSYVGDGSTLLGDWDPALPSEFFQDGDVLPFTDVVAVQYASPITANTTDNGPENANIKIFSASALASQITDDSILVVSDCTHTDVVKVNNISQGTPYTTMAIAANNNVVPMMTHEYPDGSQVSMLVSRVYYIGTNTAGEPSLTRKDLNGLSGAIDTQELVQSIENMRFLFGVDTDNDTYRTANQYLEAKDVGASWGSVSSIRLGLLIRTPSNVDMELDTNTYELVDGVTIDPADDNRRRQIYRASIQLRNQQP